MIYTPCKIISDNTKTEHSINLPIIGHCRPTYTCSRVCYAKTGRIAMPHSTRKQAYVSDYLKQSDLSQLVNECQKHDQVRLSASGDLLLKHVPSILSLARACPLTEFWGMTRKTEIAKAINHKYNNLRLLVTVDHTSPLKTWEYDGALCFGPRMPEDRVIPDMKNIVTVFPYHRRGKVVKGVARHPKDCKAVWHEISGCKECGRCWKWR